MLNTVQACRWRDALNELGSDEILCFPDDAANPSRTDGGDAYGAGSRLVDGKLGLLATRITFLLTMPFCKLVISSVLVTFTKTKQQRKAACHSI